MRYINLSAMWATGKASNGKLIVIEGFDGSGKTTQIERLETHLKRQELAILTTRQPTEWYRKNTTVQRFFRNGASLEDVRSMARLSAADRYLHLKRVIKPALASGEIVLCDRYVYSALALFVNRGLDCETIIDLNKGVLKPDVAIFLDVSPAVLTARLQARDGYHLKYEERTLEMIARITATYRKISKELVIVNGEASPECVFASIIAVLPRCLRSVA